MTCREKLKIEHPEYVNESFVGGCKGCPSAHGYLDDPECCKPNHVASVKKCAACWDREIPETEVLDGYRYRIPKEPLILEPEDWTEEEWATLCKLFGMNEAEWIKVSDYTLETYGIPYTGDENQ